MHPTALQRRITPARLLLFAALAFVAICMLFALAGCSKQDALDANARQRDAVIAGATWLDTADATLTTAQASGVPLSAFWDALRPLIPPEKAASVDRVIANGGDGFGALLKLVAASRLQVEETLADLEAQRRQIEALPDDADATGQALTGGAAILGSLLASPLPGAVVGLVLAVGAWFRADKRGEKRGEVKGRAEGALEVGASVAAGRVADPAFNAAFVDDTQPAARAMRARLGESWPEVVEAVSKANAAAKTSKAPAVDPLASANGSSL